MNDPVERLLHEWLSDGPDRGPQGALDRALAATRRTAQRPSWNFPARWIPGQERPTAMLRPLMLLTLVGLVLAALTAALTAGSRPPTPDPFRGVVLPSSGPQTLVPAAGDRAIAFVTDAGGSSLVLVSPSGERQAVDLGDATCGLLSPDQRQLALRRGEIGAVAVAPIDRIGEAVVVDPGWTTDEQVTWSPSGDLVAAVATSDGARGDRNLRVSATDGSGSRSILPDGFVPTSAVWSRDGRWIAFYGRPDDRLALYVVRPDGSELRRLADVHSGYRPEGISWSPDSSRVAFVSRAAGVAMLQSGVDPVDIFIVGVDGSSPENLTNTPEQQERWPAWSPASESLAFVPHEGARSSGIDILDLGSRRRTSVPDGARRSSFAWSPAGDALAHLRMTGEDGAIGELWISPLNKLEAERRLTDPVSLRCGAISW